MSEEAELKEPVQATVKIGSGVWVFGLLLSLSGLILQLNGLITITRPGLGSFVWWGGSILIQLIGLGYFIVFPIWLLTLSYYQYKITKQSLQSLHLVLPLVTIVSAILWAVSFGLFRTTLDISIFALSFILWAGSIIPLGVSFILTGIIYLLRSEGRRVFSYLTGLSFMIVGGLGLVVGYVGGFTFLPWFSIYDIPWVTSAGIIPCISGILLSRNAHHPSTGQ